MSKFNQGNTKAGKLTGVQVMEIREKYASRLYTQNRLAREYQVTNTTIQNIVHGVTWQSLPSVQPDDVIDEAIARSIRKLDGLSEPVVELSADDQIRLAADLAHIAEANSLPESTEDAVAVYLRQRQETSNEPAQAKTESEAQSEGQPSDSVAGHSASEPV
jgi:predicted transcriptional regulator